MSGKAWQAAPGGAARAPAKPGTGRTPSPAAVRAERFRAVWSAYPRKARREVAAKVVRPHRPGRSELAARSALGGRAGAGALRPSDGGAGSGGAWAGGARVGWRPGRGRRGGVELWPAVLELLRREISAEPMAAYLDGVDHLRLVGARIVLEAWDPTVSSGRLGSPCDLVSEVECWSHMSAIKHYFKGYQLWREQIPPK